MALKGVTIRAATGVRRMRVRASGYPPPRRTYRIGFLGGVYGVERIGKN